MTQQIPFVSVEVNLESINHFFLHCPEYCEARQTLFANIQSIDKILLKWTSQYIEQTVHTDFADRMQ